MFAELWAHDLIFRELCLGFTTNKWSHRIWVIIAACHAVEAGSSPAGTAINIAELAQLVEQGLYTAQVVGSNPTPRTKFGAVVELVDTLHLECSSSEWEFESPQPYQNTDRGQDGNAADC
mgnify:CR=1 FL=1